MAKIHVLNGADVGRSFDVAAGAILGREASCDIPLRDPSVSRKHARLELDGGRWRVVDTESRNGLYVRGERVRELALDDLTEFRLGDVELRFRTEVSANAAPPKAPPKVPAAPEELDEIVLEGDWSAPPSAASASASPAAPSAPAPKPAVAPPRPAATPASGRPAPRAAPSDASGAPAAPRTGAFGSAVPSAGAAPASAQPARTTPPLAATAARARPAQGVVAAGRGVLQFNKVENRAGLFNADLAQMPAWMKLAIGVLALIVFAALFWISFRGASFLKGKTQSTPEAVEGESGEPR